MIQDKRCIHLDFHTSEKIKGIGADFKREEFVAALKEANLDSITVFAKCHHGNLYYHSDKYFTHPHLEIPLLEPQNTKITVGETKLTLTDQNNKDQHENADKIQNVIKDIEENRSETTEVKNQVLTQQTTIINTCEEIILGALESYVETGNYEEFRQTVEAQLKIMSDQISLNFEETTTQIENVNGDLQNKVIQRLSKLVVTVSSARTKSFLLTDSI